MWFLRFYLPGWRYQQITVRTLIKSRRPLKGGGFLFYAMAGTNERLES